MSWSDFARRLMEDGLEGTLGRYYSRYRGIVMDNADPDGQDRVLVQVPRLNVRGQEALPIWAYPDYSGVTIGAGAGQSEVPPVGSHIWVTFEDGQVSKPVYTTGGYWSKGEKPAAVFPNLDWRGWVSRNGHRFLRHDPEDGPGELIWQHGSGQSVRQLPTGEVEVRSGESVAVVAGDKITVSTGTGQRVVLEAGKITIEGGAQVEVKATSVVLSASSVALGDASAPHSLIKGPALTSYLTTLVVWLTTHVHGPPGSPPVAPPPPFIPSTVLSRKSRTS